MSNFVVPYLSACFGDDETEFEKMEKTLNFLAEFYGKDWDKAEKDPIFMD